MTDVQNLTEEQFLAASADRFQERSGMPRQEAIANARICLDNYLQFEGRSGQLLAFGDPLHDWTKNAAVQLADDEMSYW